MESSEIQIGESYVGSGPVAAHINTVLGRRDGPVGASFVTALATPRAGHAGFLVIAAPGTAAVPPTLFVNKASISSDAHGQLTWGPAQAGVARGVGMALGEGVIGLSEAGELALIVAAWVNPKAGADPEAMRAVYENNASATLEALRNGRAGGPGVDAFLAAAESPYNSFYRPEGA